MGYYQECAIPKPTPRKKVKARKGRADAKALRAFRDAVWAREAVGFSEFFGVIARCQWCGCVVSRGQEGRTADVHHRIGRRDKAHRYDPDNGVLLCNHPRHDCHGKAQRHEIEV